MSKRKLQNHRRNRNAQYYAEELVNILEVLEKRQRRENTLSSDQKDTNEWKTLRIPNSRSLRSRKNRTGLWLEEKERDAIEHIIDEMNPTKLQNEDNEESEDFQDAVSDMSEVILDDAGTTTLPSDISKNINTDPMKNAQTMKVMDR